MKQLPKVASIGLLAALTVAGIVYADSRYRDARVAEAAAQFQLMGYLRLSALENYFATTRAELSFWSDSERIAAAMINLKEGWMQLGDNPGASLQRLYNIDNIPTGGRLADMDKAGDGSAYSENHAMLHPLAREFVTGRGYYDFFLIDLKGNIIYTVEKEADFGTNLIKGPYKDSNLAQTFLTLVESPNTNETIISDFARYAPSNNVPAIFAGKLLTDADGEAIGVLAVQLPDDSIRNIMQFTTGMGESGETYLVGEDLLMRSDSRFSTQSTVLETTVDTGTVRKALQGERGYEFTPDYRGIPVLSAYDSIDLGGTRWAVMAEIDEAELDKDAGSLRTAIVAVGVAIFMLLIASFAALRDIFLVENTTSVEGLSDNLDMDVNNL